jgi:membrane protease subunit HflK
MPDVKKFLKPLPIIIVIVALLALVFLFTSFFVVDQTERAVVTTFGAFSYIAEPGLHYKLPFGIQQNINVPTEIVQTSQFGFGTIRSDVESEYDPNVKPIVMLTGDLNVVLLEWVVQYKIVDPKAWTFNVYWRHKLIEDVSQSVMNQLVGDASFYDITTNARVRIEGEAMNMMNEALSSFNIGVNVIAVKFQNVEMPGAVQAAFSDVSNAKTDYLKFKNEAQEQYNAVVPKAKGEADKVVAQAEGYAYDRVKAAEAEVNRFLEVYEEYLKAPAITKQRLYYEMMETVFGGQESVTLIDKNLNNIVPLLNLGGDKAVGQ